jgi:hypothetical protein
MNKNFKYMIYICCLLLAVSPFIYFGCKPGAANNEPEEPEILFSRAGLRASSYGAGNPFPVPDYWVNSTNSMASRFQAATPTLVWIVGIMHFRRSGNASGNTILNFPPPTAGASYSNIIFSTGDENEEYLNAFDQNGVKVWLQVEPADADISTLIQLVMDRYASHPSVIGFGVDVEWHRYGQGNQEGSPVTDNQARAWSELVRGYHPSFMLFLKHWLISKMPPNYREGIMFLDDSQQFNSMNQMVAEFEQWGRNFFPSPVGFQYGYSADRTWWNGLGDPPRDIGDEILSRIPNTSDLFWVDFTMTEIWPID